MLFSRYGTLNKLDKLNNGDNGKCESHTDEVFNDTDGAESEEMKAYIHGEVVPSEKKGWCLVCADDYSIGWGKGDGRVLKNHYPKGLRR